MLGEQWLQFFLQTITQEEKVKTMYTRKCQGTLDVTIHSESVGNRLQYVTIQIGWDDERIHAAGTIVAYDWYTYIVCIIEMNTLKQIV